MPRQKGDRLVMSLSYEKSKEYKAFAHQKGVSLSELIYSLLQKNAGIAVEKPRFHIPDRSKIDMFNEPRKLEFIKETFDSENLRKKAASLFFKSKPIEYDEGLDIVEWADDVLFEFLKSLPIHETTRRQYESILKKYVAWCRDKRMPYSDSIFFFASK